MVIIGIILGVSIFLTYIALYIILNRAYKIHPLIHLGGFYFLFTAIENALPNIIPEAWKIKQINTPLQMDGSIGFFFRLNQPKMSVYEIGMAVLLVCFTCYFIYNVGVKQFLKKKNR